jgi:hypothetical protein
MPADEQRPPPAVESLSPEVQQQLLTLIETVDSTITDMSGALDFCDDYTKTEMEDLIADWRNDLAAVLDAEKAKALRWTIAPVIDKNPDTCWVSTVFWSESGSEDGAYSPKSSNRDCAERPLKDGCYCGKIRGAESA